MEYVWEIVLTVLCLMGLGLLVWCLMGRLVCPVPGQEVIVDLGLDREGLAVAQRLALRWPVVDLYRPEDGAEAH